MEENVELEKITIEDKDGKVVECDVIEEFIAPETNKKYMIYTSYNEVENGDVEIYASIIDESGDKPILRDLMDEKDREIISVEIEKLYAGK